MTLEELEKEVAAIKARVEALEKKGVPKEGDIDTTPFGKMIFKNGRWEAMVTKHEWTPPIPNTIDEVPVVADIRAEKLAYIELPNGHKLWAAIHLAANKVSYQEIVPPITDACGKAPEAGQFSIGSSPKDLPAATKYLRKEWNAYYLEKFPPTKCHPIAGTWELEPDEE